ncbi:MAG: hypothetical protein HYZ54_14400 [Ignavibacteriae bacterium]|nr:hypothetical protein [Ignavibacteriota bacterium]
MRKTLKTLLWSFLVMLCLTVIVLGTHIYLVTRPKPIADIVQLGRIDFKQDIDSLEGNRIRSFVSHLDGVKSTYFNYKDRILVYTYSSKIQSSVNVYNLLAGYGNFKAERYVVGVGATKSGCPIGADKQSYTGTVSSYISGFFK